ncbi:MAG: nuclear transport factor 2 family protein [Bacteroidetes bacterium]|nr:MAG: nuclear transport factor 2 family protein [Bacteroidota bacterium]
MRLFFLIALAFVTTGLFGQGEEAKLTMTIKEFHQSLVNKNMTSIDQHTDKALSYGHSNGWVETKTDMIKDLETGYIVYHNYKEDSLSITVNGKMANARFVANISATLHGNTTNFHLKVLEVWVNKGNRWILFARQAVR